MHQKSLLVIVSCSILALALTATSKSSTLVAAPAAVHQDANSYVGADACKSCHGGHLDAWSNTKHQKALGKLQGGDRESGKCIRCHVTGSPEMIEADGAKPRLPGVQCEACHGAGGTHVEQAKTKAIVKGAITAVPDEGACTKCHSEESPHYKPFFYSAMKGLVHPVKKY